MTVVLKGSSSSRAVWCARVMRGVMRTVKSVLAAAVLALVPGSALAWGDEGHKVIALIAEHYLNPAVDVRVTALLAADTDPLTAHDMASEASWADKYRDSDRNGTKERYLATRQWHFASIELDNPSLDRACFEHPSLPTGVVASNGPARACVVDKINQFSVELADSSSNIEERLTALKFLLHLVGDLHQPLHTADDHDLGGNRKRVVAEGFVSGNLHHFWDIEFVERLGSDPGEVARALIATISDEDQREWSEGTAADWAMESFGLARNDAYGRLPELGVQGAYVLDAAYIAAAARDIRFQLSRAGVRLALVLNKALGSPP
jgi:hypothetical protein